MTAGSATGAIPIESFYMIQQPMQNTTIQKLNHINSLQSNKSAQKNYDSMMLLLQVGTYRQK